MNRTVKVKWQGETLKCVVGGDWKHQHLHVVSVTSQQGEEISTGNCSIELLSHIINEARLKKLQKIGISY